MADDNNPNGNGNGGGNGGGNGNGSTTAKSVPPSIEALLNSLNLRVQKVDYEPLINVHKHGEGEQEKSYLVFKETDESVADEDRFLNGLAALMLNVQAQIDRETRKAEELKAKTGKDAPPTPALDLRRLMQRIDAITEELDKRICKHISDVMHSDAFRNMERNWRSVAELVSTVEPEKNEFGDVVIDLLDVTKDELGADLQDHSNDILTSELFRKIYVDEYDRFGGEPFGCMVGLYEFDKKEEDIEFLETMSRMSAGGHIPFVAAADPKFFGGKGFDELDRLGNLNDILSTRPEYNKWRAFRDRDEAAYVGLTLPRYMMRMPYENHSSGRKTWTYTEDVDGAEDYLWGNATVPFVQNMIRAFQLSGWCQHICGPRGGGLIKGLPQHTIRRHERDEVQPAIEVSIPDYRELQLAESGFMPLIQRKNTDQASFFSARSAKRAIEFEDELDTQNADLVCNLAYTLSVTRIAHYVKRMVRDYIGSSADGPYIQDMLQRWLVDYVTTVVNPDDLTLTRYPFKKVNVEVQPKPGPLGWYKATIEILPHVKFEGMDVELRLEAQLGGAAAA